MDTEQEIHEINQKLNNMAVDFKEIRTVLLGPPQSPNGGLVESVNKVCNAHNKLSRNFYLLVGILAGSGILGGSVFGILQVLGQ